MNGRNGVWKPKKNVAAPKWGLISSTPKYEILFLDLLTKPKKLYSYKRLFAKLSLLILQPWELFACHLAVVLARDGFQHACLFRTQTELRQRKKHLMLRGGSSLYANVRRYSVRQQALKVFDLLPGCTTVIQINRGIPSTGFAPTHLPTLSTHSHTSPTTLLPIMSRSTTSHSQDGHQAYFVYGEGVESDWSIGGQQAGGKLNTKTPNLSMYPLIRIR